MNATNEVPITTGETAAEQRCFRLCQCAQCGVVARCVPGFDFFTLFDDDLGPLYCEPCADELTNPENLPVIDQRPSRGSVADA